MTTKLQLLLTNSDPCRQAVVEHLHLTTELECSTRPARLKFLLRQIPPEDCGFSEFSEEFTEMVEVGRPEEHMMEVLVRDGHLHPHDVALGWVCGRAKIDELFELVMRDPRTDPSHDTNYALRKALAGNHTRLSTDCCRILVCWSS